MILTHKIRRLIGKLSPRHRLAAAAIAVPCFSVVAAFGIAPDTLVDKVTFNNVVEELTLPTLAPVADREAGFAREERIQRGDTVASLLARLQIDDPAATQVLRNNAQAKALYQLIPGKVVRATATSEGKLLSLRYLSGSNLVSIDRAADNFVVKQEAVDLERRVLMKSAEIRNSLFGATDAAGLPDTIATQIAEIFSTDIDFHRDLRKGDRFSVVYEVFYDRGEPVKSGRVLAAEFVNQGKAYTAVYFNYAENEGGYYTADGKNLRKQFLRSPLEFSRITSGFSTARFHPVLQTWRAHKGIDYGAPTGTRVKATADGVVDIAGRQGGYGNVVVLRHQSKFTTWYGHLSGIAKGLHKGKRVMQGEVIGFVGATGMATGPHLHYEFRIDGTHRDPLSVTLPKAEPLPQVELARFHGQTQPMLAKLKTLEATQVALAK